MTNPIGFHSVGLHRYPVETAIEKVAAAGYDCIELNAETLAWAQPHVTPDLAAAERRVIRSRVENAGLFISSIGAHISLVEAESPSRKANLDYALGCLELAGDLKAPMVHLISGPLPAGMAYDEGFRWLADAVSRCIHRGESLGVSVAFEPVATHLVCNAESMMDLVKTLLPQTLYVNIDPSHLIVHGDDIPADVNRFGSRIVHVHIKDGRGTPGDYQFPPLGQGAVDFAGLVEALKEIGYQGVLSIEYEANAFGYEQTEDEIVNGSLGFVKKMTTP